MSTLAFSAMAQDNMLRGFSTSLDSGVGGGRLNIYTGTAPSPGGSPVGSVLLVSLEFPKPAAMEFTGGALVLNNPPMNVAIGTGHADWARFINGSGVWVADVVGIGELGDSSGHMILIEELDILAGAEVTVQIAKIRWP